MMWLILLRTNRKNQLNSVKLCFLKGGLGERRIRSIRFFNREKGGLLADDPTQFDLKQLVLRDQIHILQR